MVTLQAMPNSCARQHFFNALRQTQYRQFIALCGDKQWGINYVRDFIHDIIGAQANCLSNIDIDGTHCVDNTKLVHLLGQECEHFIFNAHEEFDPNHLGIIGGMVKAAGIVFFIMPPLKNWQQSDNPYLRFIARILHDDQRAMLIKQTDRHDALYLQGAQNLLSATTQAWPNYSSQNQAVNAIKHVVHGQRRRPAVIYADRGRGKSAALGIAASELIAQGTSHITITAKSKSAAQTVFKHITPAHLSQGAIEFVAVDALVARAKSTDLVLVDEAASLPIAQLQQLLKRYPRIAFASTVHGYEGSGRGFLIHFTKLLDCATRGWQRVELGSPIRWRDDDPLELLLFRLLMLDADIAGHPDSMAENIAASMAKSPTISHIALSANELCADEKRLRQLFGLLTLAHYRTSPRDLYYLLSQANWKIYAALDEQSDQLIAALVCIDEGVINTAHIAPILAGKRRPKGHLLAQALAIHNGIDDALQHHYQRITRIVVHPDYQRQGTGSALLQFVLTQIEATHIVGTSFSMQTHVLEFWQQNQFQLVRIGNKASASSVNEHAIYLHQNGDLSTNLIKQSQQTLFANLPFLIATTLQHTADELIAKVLQQLSDNYALANSELKTLSDFAYFNRPVESAIYALKNALPLICAKTATVSYDDVHFYINQIGKNALWQQTGQYQKSSANRIRLILRDFLCKNHSAFIAHHVEKKEI